MTREPKKVLVDGDEEGVGMAVHSASSVQLCKTGIYGRTDGAWTAVSNILRSEKLEDISYPMLRDFQGVASPVCRSGKSNV
jgi:hypothetical protein